MRRLECLDGLRGVLAVYVLLGHMAPFATIPPILERALSHGGAAVDVFFMLSGLVILRALESLRYHSRPFLIARVARIYPLYLLTLAVAVAVQPLPLAFPLLPWIGPDSLARDIWSTGWPSAWRVEIGTHLLMLHGLLPDGVVPGGWVSFLGSAWSLSTEWQFYVLAMLVGGRFGARRMAELFLGLAVLGLAWRLGASETWQFSRAFLPNKAQFFALGIAGAVLLRGEPKAARFYGLVLLGTLIVCLAQGGPDKLAAPLVWTVALGAQAYPRLLRPLAAVLGTPILLRLGAWSYGIYLANEPIHKLLGLGLAWLAAGDALLFTLLWVPLAVLLPIATAAWLHRHVELPAQRAGRRPTEATASAVPVPARSSDTTR